MKYFYFLILLFLFAAPSYADQKAITDTGEQVILKSNGTWIYVDKTQKSDQIIETNKIIFYKPQSSTFLIKSTRNKSAFWINPDKWKFNKTKINDASEYEFELKGKDLYGIAITEGVEIPIETLANIAFDNAKDHAPDMRIVKQEYRVVNGKKLIYMEMVGTVKNINITYYGYYYSTSAGSTQFVAYTVTNAGSRYGSDIIDFLNGLDMQ